MKKHLYITTLRVIATAVCAAMTTCAVFASAATPSGDISSAANASETSAQTKQTGQTKQTAQAKTSSQQPQAVGPQASCSATNWVNWGTPYSGPTGVSGMDRSTVQWRITSDCVLHLSGGLSPNIPNSSTYVPWINEQDEITGIKVEGNLTLYKSNIALNPIFADMPNLTTVDTTGGQLHLAANAAGGLFESDDQLATINGITSWDTKKATGMASMFYFCPGLTQLDLSGFDTTNVEDMTNMFDGDNGLESITLSGNFKTGKVTSMDSMFNNCSGLTSLDLSSFDTSAVKSMKQMFSSCRGLTSLDFSTLPNFNTANVTNMDSMFLDCTGLTSLNVSNFATNKVANMNSMFNDCSSLTTLDLSNFNTANVTNMNAMFQSCSGLTSIKLSSFATNKVANMNSMFDGCTNLTTLDISSFDTSQAGSSMTNMLPNGLRKLKLGASTKLGSDAFSNVDSGINWEEMSSLDDSATHIGSIGNLSALKTRAASSNPAGSYWDSRFMPSGVQLAVNANGGITNFTPVSYDTTTAAATITVPRGNAITTNKSQSIFSGWNTCARGGTTGGCQAYQPNDTITVAQGDSYPARTITLYAQWVRAPAPVIDPYSPAIHAPLTTSPTIDVTVSNTAGPAGGPAANALIGSKTTITTGQGPWSTETGPGTWSYTGRPIADLQPNMGATYVIKASTTMTDPSTGNTVTAYTQKNGILPYLKVTFNANGGTGAPSDMSGFGDPDNYSLTPFTIPADVIPTKGPHDMFAGWATSATATQPDPAYNPGNHAPTYFTNADAGKTLTLYAVWHEAKAPVITEVHRDSTSHHVIATGTAQPFNAIGTPTVSGNSSKGLKVTSASLTSDGKLSVTGLASGTGNTEASQVVTVRVRACYANTSGSNGTAPPAKARWSNDNNNIPSGCVQDFGIPDYHPGYLPFSFWLAGLNNKWSTTNLDIGTRPYIWAYTQYQNGSIDGPLMITPLSQGSDNSVKTCVKPTGTAAGNYVCGTATMDNVPAFDGTTAHSWSLDLPESTAFDAAKAYDTSSHLYIDDTWRNTSGGGGSSGGGEGSKLSVISPEAYLGSPPPVTALPFTGGRWRRVAVLLGALIGSTAVLLVAFVTFRRRILRLNQ
ncbi:BspA family leucine-rich repeat surface protein [Bifidobacterium sp. ESL0728]|uniref:BspA family leucine-rich repeat surface protein n=1 Tax=Bifidobacterium sp. ESL0728 TaxID=2983220 RepID=UPI0023F728F1|nr:BspA family leucine-rich repeat surface protein [Bifidobacterium sp. ESL0728]WEV58947.1 BspA family leucine-rich repeat surface protein [Bifidobacterium sp. ESL0728]